MLFLELVQRALRIERYRRQYCMLIAPGDGEETHLRRLEIWSFYKARRKNSNQLR
jgi:hypothetical protein